MRFALALVMLIGCSGASPNRAITRERSGPSLVGAWDATLSLTRPYQLALYRPVARRICGTIGFVGDHREAGNVADTVVRDLGVYDLDLSRLGLDWLEDLSYPAAIATAANGSSKHLTQDSVAIVLNPGSRERIVLLGRYTTGRIDGDWLAQSARGTASGVFSLKPHASVSAGWAC